MDRVNNILILIAAVHELPESAFTENLNYWANDALRQGHACGAVGCLGGWAAHVPQFQDQGVLRSVDGIPRLPYSFGPSEVAGTLFGEENLFDARRFRETGTEKSICLARLERALNRELEAMP
jgi:hypothetical protein